MSRIGQRPFWQGHTTADERRFRVGRQLIRQLQIGQGYLVPRGGIAGQALHSPALRQGRIGPGIREFAGKGQPVGDVTLSENHLCPRCVYVERRQARVPEIDRRLSGPLRHHAERFGRALGKFPVCEQRASPLVVHRHPPRRPHPALHGQRRGGGTLDPPDVVVAFRVLVDGELAPDIVIRLVQQLSRGADVKLVPVPRVPLHPPIPRLDHALAPVEPQRHPQRHAPQKTIRKISLGRQFDRHLQKRTAGHSFQRHFAADEISLSEIQPPGEHSPELPGVPGILVPHWLIDRLDNFSRRVVAPAVVILRLQHTGGEQRRVIIAHQNLVADVQRAQHGIIPQLETNRASVHSHPPVNIDHFQPCLFFHDPLSLHDMLHLSPSPRDQTQRDDHNVNECQVVIDLQHLDNRYPKSRLRYDDFPLFKISTSRSACTRRLGPVPGAAVPGS